MVEVFVFAEGDTEEQFIKTVLIPIFKSRQIFLKPQKLNTSKQAKGGAVTFDRLKFNALNTLRQHPQAILTTFLDLYALDTSFPGVAESRQKATPQSKASFLEAALHAAIIKHVHCRADRFMPHIQPYEFEGLLFSDIDALVLVEPGWAARLDALRQIRAACETPEHINDSYETKPSRRLETLLRPGYKKTLHGPRAAQRITLETMERECPHFRGWVEKLRGLGGV